MSIETLSTLFPLIDDPVNIFYSRLKSFFLSQFPSFLQVKCLNRVKSLVEIHLPYTSQIWKVKFDSRKLPTSVTEGLDQGKTYGVYAEIVLNKTRLANYETTMSGEEIPVDEIIYSINNIYNSPRYIESKERVLVEVRTTSISIFVRICNTLTRYSRYFYEGLDKTSYKDTYTSLYKPVIGRKIRFYSEDRTDIEHGQVVELWQWDLYDIDSDYNETLIDSFSVDKDSSNNIIQDSCKSCGYKYMWPLTYGPSVDHPIRLTFCKEKSSANPYDTSEPFEITVMEHSFASANDPVDIFLYPLTDAYFDNRGLCTDPLGWVCNHIRIGTKGDSNGDVRRRYYKEEIALALCFLLNINFRFLYSYFDAPDYLSCINIKTNCVNVPQEDFGRRITVPDNMDNGYGYTQSYALAEMAKVYFEEPFGLQRTIDPTSTNVPLVQNSLVYGYESPFTRFRQENQNLLNNMRIAFSNGDNIYIKSKYPSTTDALHTIQELIKSNRIASLTSSRYVNNSLLFE